MPPAPQALQPAIMDSLLASQKESTAVTASLLTRTSELYHALNSTVAASVAKAMSAEVKAVGEAISDEVKRANEEVLGRIKGEVEALRGALKEALDDASKQHQASAAKPAKITSTQGTQTSLWNEDEDEDEEEARDTMVVVPETQDGENPFQDLLDMANGQDSDEVRIGDLKRASSPGTFKDLESDFARRKSPRREKRVSSSQSKAKVLAKSSNAKGSPMRSGSDDSWTFDRGSGGSRRTIEAHRQQKPARSTRSNRGGGKKPRR